MSFILAMNISSKELAGNQYLILVTLIFMWYFTSKYTNLYDDFRTTTYVNEVLVLIPNVIFQLISVGFIYFAINDHAYVRKFTMLYIGIFFSILLIKNYISKKWALYKWSSGFDTKNVIIVGTGIQGIEFHKMLSSSKQFGYNPIGFIDKSTNHQSGELNILGSIENIENILLENQVQEIIISLTEFDSNTVKKILMIADKHAIKTRIIPEYFHLISSKFKLETFGHLPIITVRDEPLEEFHWYIIKTIADYTFTILLFIFIFSWLLPLIALAIKLDSKGPVFFIQERWGKNGKIFKCFKFRTMKHNSSTVKGDGKFYQTTKNDSRITRVGYLLRKTNLDELPQFFNILLGEMSVVGPRPHAVKHSEESYEQIENYLVRHLVKPGITGWAQVNGYRGETTDIFLMKKRVEFDIWYIENWSVWLDIRVVIMTIYNMLKGDMMAY